MFGSTFCAAGCAECEWISGRIWVACEGSLKWSKTPIFLVVFDSCRLTTINYHIRLEPKDGILFKNVNGFEVCSEVSKWSSYIGYWWQHNCFRQETYKIICLALFQARNESTGLYSHVFSANWSWLWLACGVDKSSLEHTHNSNVSSQNTTNIFYFYGSLVWLGLRDALFFPKGSIFHYLFMFCCSSFFSSHAVVQWNTCRCLAESVGFSNLVIQ